MNQDEMPLGVTQSPLADIPESAKELFRIYRGWDERGRCRSRAECRIFERWMDRFRDEVLPGVFQAATVNPSPVSMHGEPPRSSDAEDMLTLLNVAHSKIPAGEKAVVLTFSAVIVVCREAGLFKWATGAAVCKDTPNGPRWYLSAETNSKFGLVLSYHFAGPSTQIKPGVWMRLRLHGRNQHRRYVFEIQPASERE